ncbi:MAG: hypothetical protein JWO32_296, partial [Bacteroidetes bacterium]|nr:hypothetical protein [Bacteroidota bacterium]
QVQIFGTDISEPAISKARTGIYNKAELAHLSDEQIKNYFSKHANGYQVGRVIRDMCVFAVHNFLKDPPFAKMDLISCRNVMIYLETFLQKNALTTFHYALKEHGFLLLGKSETAAAAADLFNAFIKPDKIYSRAAVPGRFNHVASNRSENIAKEQNKTARQAKNVQVDFRKTAENILLEKYTPVSVVVNEHMDIVHINGSINTFLEPSPGKPNFNLIKMARGSLAFELRNAVHKVKASNTLFIKEGIPVEDNEKGFSVTIEVMPLPDTVDSYYLILFHKVLKSKTKKGEKGKDVKSKELLARVEQLEKELAQGREDMLSITEEQETSNEELQSANEELLSGSEELQSLNEELETAKEEVQSTNEELVVVNQELLDKQDELNADRTYAQAIIQTLREPLIILDKEFRIKTAAASFCKKFQLKESEIEGQFFYEIQNGLWNDSFLRSMLEKILPKKTKLDDFEIKLNFPSIGECTFLLNARQLSNEKSDEDLILLAIEEITEQKILEQQKKIFAEELEHKVKERTLALERSRKQLDQFSHTASHEFQEPLRKIVTFSKYLQDLQNEELSHEIKTNLHKIEKACLRMSVLVQNTVTFASLTKHEQLFEKTNLNNILKDILYDFEMLIAEKKIKITSEDLPVLEAVPFQITQLFYDLIGNAIKFCKPDGRATLHISARKVPQQEMKSYPDLNHKLSYYELTFKDNGIGFEQKYAPKIFTMFQRLHDANNYGGTGIGLALCKKIVENYQGEISVKAKVNEGACFYVYLPVAQRAGAK